MRGIGPWIASYCEWEAREPHAESLLYRILNEAHVQQPPPKSRVLCTDAPTHVRIMRMALHRIPDDQRICLWMKFSYPMNDRGQLYSAAEIAKFLGVSKRAYHRCVRAGKKRISLELSDLIETA